MEVEPAANNSDNAAATGKTVRLPPPPLIPVMHSKTRVSRRSHSRSSIYPGRLPVLRSTTSSSYDRRSFDLPSLHCVACCKGGRTRSLLARSALTFLRRSDIRTRTLDLPHRGRDPTPSLSLHDHCLLHMTPTVSIVISVKAVQNIRHVQLAAACLAAIDGGGDPSFLLLTTHSSCLSCELRVSILSVLRVAVQKRPSISGRNSPLDAKR